MRDPIRYAFDAEHFLVNTTYTGACYPWAQLWDWREGERTIIVLPTPRNFYVIAKRGADPAALERLRGYLMQARKRRP
jgi:DNA/RNA-binding domain of Phe-tRNA-synthetase-like protein